MKIEKTELSDNVIITPKRFGDHRGFFSESFSQRDFEAAGLCYTFVQDNHSLSSQVGTVRGLHFQSPPHAQDKLVRCSRGRLFDAVVDVRKGSPTYGKWVGEILSFENGKQLLVPKGFLHGFMTLEANTEVVYKCSDYYVPDCDGSVRWNSCGVAWPIDTAVPVLSEKDTTAQEFVSFDSPFDM
ncbi:dTDP-4-dehydrorhamnose 3,5-epimerase [Falsihalocynthiibacter sp. BN13B15]|uniref:dTDP-4-dehydrorhamnose 3,5-epimerase n=1 Tax=Falsihalocynthiibacter sp. BN13B15 TaxID=3240871 RepID=UPI00350EBAC9